MKQLKEVLLGILLLLGMTIGTAVAAEKKIFLASDTTLTEAFLSGSGLEQTGWVDIFSSNMTIASQKQKGLLVNVSLQTTVFLFGTPFGLAQCSANVRVRVVLDAGTPQERIFEPGEVEFPTRSQVLTGQPDDTTQLGTGTVNANSFNFGLEGVSPGPHNVDVQAEIVLQNSGSPLVVTSQARVDKGSVTIEEK